MYTVSGLAIQSLPQALKDTPRWMGTRLKRRADGKLDKPPYRVRRGLPVIQAAKNNPDNWASFEEALKALRAGKVDAIGYVFTDEDDWTAIDLDGVRDPETGEIEPWALEIVKAIVTYWETSISETGLHGFCAATKPTERCKSNGIELYDNNRFMVLTGCHLEGTPSDIRPCQEEINALVRKHFPTPQREEGPRGPVEPIDLADEKLLEVGRNSRKGEEFCALHDRGDISAHEHDHSKADFALMRWLAFLTGWDAVRMESLFDASALGQREKWRRRTDYRERTIESAIAATPRAYRQLPKASSELTAPIETLRALAERLAWEGRGGPADRHVYGAMVDLGAKYGTLKKSGIAVGTDTRTIALQAGVGLPTVWRSLGRLEEDRKLIRRLRKGKGTRGTLFLLKLPRVHSTQALNTQPCVVECYGLRSLRNPAPKPRKKVDKRGRPLSVSREFLLERVGKLAALIIERVAMHDAVSLKAVAANLGRRPCDLRRKVHVLLQTGLLVEEGGLLRIPEDFEYRLEVELEESGCNDAARRDRDRYVRDRKARRRYLADGGASDEAPTGEELSERRRHLTLLALDAFCHEGSGPQMVLHAYLDRQTHMIEYVIKAVAHYYGRLDRWGEWERPVRDAISIYAGKVRRS